ncbi:MAG: HAD-IIIC family phosphatase [Eubacteriales bacterium]|nr:HAD-IIIC family phosphatase [Eubacteriales bacterium]
MLPELQYPFDSELILKKSKSLKRRLLEDGSARIRKRIAVLGGSTTHDVVRILELFLLNQGIEPEFYESEYGMYWEDAVFGNEALRAFAPELIYVHTSLRNLRFLPKPQDTPRQVEEKLEVEYRRFEQMWEKLEESWHCPVIQNNFEPPYFRLLGNQDGVAVQGRTCYVNRMNEKLADYARSHKDFWINDISYQSAVYGLDKWSAPEYWHMYKYCLCLPAIPWLAHNVANIVKSLFGKNKKSLVLDLDNTLWGGVIGDDGVEGIEIGQETNMGQVYAEFQSYVKLLRDIGVMLNVASKNEEENALAGLSHPESVLSPEDFLLIKANWEPKSRNLLEIARQLNILPESLVFADDNPAEREIVRQQAPEVTAPEIGRPEDYIRVLDRGGYFEVTALSEDDRKRNEMYRANLEREQLQSSFADYQDYLRSLEMKAQIAPFAPVYMARIAQLTNKSNQFNLTTWRLTQSEIEQMAADPQFFTLYGRLEDKFGDNGVVSVVIAQCRGKEAHIRLWLMSCRVLKRDMELAMLDSLAERCRAAGIETLYGYYYPTAKNGMVREFYGQLGFERTGLDAEQNSVWRLELSGYEKKNHVIAVEKCDAV